MERYYIAFWNVENLFAPENYPDRIPWLAKAIAKDLEGWTEALFQRKLDQLAKVIASFHGGAGPDLLGVCEIENEFVLDELVTRLNAKLGDRRYRKLHADSEKDKRGIDTAFIFDSKRLKAVPKEFFHYFVMRRTGTRDISQATFSTKSGNEFVAMCNHWPSRSGGAAESAGYRMTAGETLSYWHGRVLEAKGSETALIALGDFNDDPMDLSLTRHALSRREKEDVASERATSPYLYNLAWRYLEQRATSKSGKVRPLYGTLYFEGDANIFDQILVSRGLLKAGGTWRVDESSAKIELFSDMISEKLTEGPIRFGLPKGNAAKNIHRDGYSDHLPVSVIIEENVSVA